MTDALPWAVLALVALSVLVALAWRRGGPLAALATALGGAVLWLATRRREPRAPSPSTPDPVHRARLDASAVRRAEAEAVTAEATAERAELAEVEDVPAGVREWLDTHLEEHRS